MSLSCQSPLQQRQNVRGADQTSDPASPSGEARTGDPLWSNNMIPVNTPGHSFFIDPYEISELGGGDYFSSRNQLPRHTVSKQDAEEICHSFGKRLCTSVEWKNACLGIQRKRYSYGARYIENNCNLATRGPALTGSHRGCRTDTEIYDMVGNVMEWVSDTGSGRNMAMGGSFSTGKKSDCFTTLYFPVGFRSPQIGFRCCK